MSGIEPTGIAAAIARVQEIMTAVTPAAPASATAPAGGDFARALARAQAPASTAAAAALPTTASAALPTTASAATGADAAALDAWMRSKVPDSPLVGLGAVFVREGQANGIDPRALVAIALNESSLGTAGSGRNINNAFGWGPAIPFASWEEGIATVARGLRRGYLDRGLDTLAEIQPVWAPVGASNDPRGLNGNWLGGVGRSFGELGGDPAASIAVAAPAAPSADTLASTQ